MSALSSLGSTTSAFTSPTTSTSSTGSTTSSTGSTSSALGTSTGLISGLDYNAIISAELAPQQAIVTQYQSEETTLNQKQAAFQQLSAYLVALQGDLGQLDSPDNSVFNARTVTSSNQNAVTAAATASAVPGNYSIFVNSLAQAQEIASQPFATENETIAQGQIQLTAGGSSQTITIDNTNDTVSGLVSAINNSGAGVTASIINNGNSTDPYQILLTASQTGTANAITIDTSGLTGSGVVPSFSGIGSANTTGTWTGTTQPTSAGTLYTGLKNDTYSFNVINGGTIPQDGTGSSSGIQIQWTDTESGQTGTLNLNNYTPGTAVSVGNNGVEVAFSAGTVNTGDSFTIAATPMVQAAQNASVTIGSGAGAITTTNSSNTIDNLITGVTLNLVGAQASGDSNVTLTVGSNTSSATTAIQNFVNDYNQVASFISQETSYDATTQTAGLLLGDTDINNIQNQLNSMVMGTVGGASTGSNSLPDLGITMNDQGQLQIDSTQLTNALNNNLAGVQQVFGLAGQVANSNITFLTATNSTQATGAPIQVTITRAATQAGVTASSALPSSVTIGSSNNTFALNLNGTASGNLTLPSGTYTPSELAAAVQAAINGASALQGQQVTVGLNSSGNLTITSNAYGSSSQVAMTSGGDALSILGFNGTESGQGTDVAGYFTVNGQEESATGSGQILTGNSSNANTSGLALNVTLTPGQLASNSGQVTSTVTVTQGVAYQLDNLITNLTDPNTGQLNTVNQDLQNQVTALNQQIARENQYMQNQSNAMLQQFAAMETTLSELKNASSYISSQTSAIQNMTNAMSSTSS